MERGDTDGSGARRGSRAMPDPNARQQDWLIYKLMAIVVVAIPAMLAPVLLLGRAWDMGSVVICTGVFFLFDLAWDLGLAWSGRGDCLAHPFSRHIVRRAARRWASTTIMLIAIDFAAGNPNGPFYLAILLLVYAGAEFALRRGAVPLDRAS